VDIIGSAANSATVTVGVSGVTNSLAGRQGDYFRQELALANTNAAAYGVVNIIASMDYNGTNVVVTNTGSAFLPKTPEQFTHDADGNLISDGRWQYTWDGENRLLSAESLTNAPVASKRKVEWTYDADGRRIRQKVYVWDVQSSVFSLQSSVLYAYDGWQCLAELNATNNAVVRSYVWGLDLSGSQTGAGGIGGLLFGTFNGSNSTSSVAYAFDGNGNVSALLDMKTGQIAAEYEYSPFGETIRATGPLAKENPFRFSTKRTDDTTGLIFYEYRILRPDIGRWLSRDPIEEEGGLLLYGFVYNDPINQVDPDGEIPLDTIWDIGNIIYDIAVGDDLSLAADVAALMIPYIPAGATKLVKAAKVADVAGVCANAKKLTVSYNYVHVSYHFPKGKDAAKNYVKWTQGGKKSLWTPGTTDAQVKGYIEKALGQAKAAGKLKPDEVKGVYDVGVEVGASNGKKVTKIKLQADSNGNIHAHPAD
jgi:RHS repeat-associated protein